MRFGIENGQNNCDFCESNIIPVKLTWLEIEEIRRGFAAGVREPLASAPGFGRFTPNGRSTCYPLSHDEGGLFYACPFCNIVLAPSTTEETPGAYFHYCYAIKLVNTNVCNLPSSPSLIP